MQLSEDSVVQVYQGRIAAIVSAIVLTSTLGAGAQGQAAPSAIADAVIAVATSWPADMGDLPAFAGEVQVDAVMADAQVNILKMMSAGQGDHDWFGAAVVPGSFAAPDRYRLSCRRVGSDVLRHARAALAGEAYPEALDFLINFDDRDTIARVTPQSAEAAMRCEHAFRIEGDAATVSGAFSQSLRGFFGDLQITPGEEGRPDALIAAGWSGDPANGVAHLVASVSSAAAHPGRVDIHAVSYSWRMQPGA